MQRHFYVGGHPAQYLYAMQHDLSHVDDEDLPIDCVHDATRMAWESMDTGYPSLLLGGLDGSRVDGHFAARLSGHTGSVVSGFRAGSRIEISFSLRL